MSEGKTPVMVVGEACTKRKMGQPNYTVISQPDSPHKVTPNCYTVRCVAADGLYDAMGYGSSKRYAKQEAAKNLLIQAIERDDHANWGLDAATRQQAYAILDALMRSVSTGKAGATGKEEGKAAGEKGPAAELNERCTKLRLPMPVYEYETIAPTQGQVQPTFSATVWVGCTEVSHTGDGASKRDARQSAARNMLKHVAEAEARMEQCIRDEMHSSFGTDALASAIGAMQLSNLSSKGWKHSQKWPLPAGTALDRQRLDAFFVRLSRGAGKATQALLTGKLMVTADADTKRILRRVADEHSVHVSYWQFDKRGDGDYECMVQLELAPIAVCYGAGKTPDAAERAAAYNALNYVKLMMAGASNSNTVKADAE